MFQFFYSNELIYEQALHTNLGGKASSCFQYVDREKAIIARIISIAFVDFE